jgi:hypothetical protein
MTNMHCERFEEMLAEQTDGPLPLEATVHLDACPRCRLLQEDLQAIAAVAHEWGGDLPAPPPRVWTAIETRLQAEGLIALPRLPAAAPAWFSGWWNLVSRLELAGAYLRNAPATATFERPATTQSVSRPALDGLGPTLDGNMRRAVASLSPEYGDSVAVSLRRNLQIVDNLIAVCEKKVRENPRDPLAREYLYGAYQQKADLLAVALDRSALEAQ